MKMTRDDFKELFGFEEGDDGLVCADEDYNTSDADWWDIAKANIRTTNLIMMDMVARRF